MTRLNAPQNIVRNIRPYKLFDLVKEPACDRVANIMIPARRAGGGTTLLETMLLIAVCRAVQAKRVFEFGTFLGTNTFNLALNVPDDGEVFTLDLPDAALVQHEADVPFAERHLATESLDFNGSSIEHKISRLTANSREFDCSQWNRSIDLAFVDGGHDRETVACDTASALSMIRSDGRAAIVWHDYGNPDYPDLTECLNRLSDPYPIFHIEDTMLCILLFGLTIE